MKSWKCKLVGTFVNNAIDRKEGKDSHQSIQLYCFKEIENKNKSCAEIISNRSGSEENLKSRDTM